MIHCSPELQRISQPDSAAERMSIQMGVVYETQRYICIQNLYRNPQIPCKMFSSARFWVLGLHNFRLSEFTIISIGMDREQVVLPILVEESHRGSD
jgi:hypothetical protein